MYILGISFSMHDSAVALLKDGVIIYSAEEERFNRVKHSSDFPHKSIEYALKQEGIGINDIDYIGFNFRKDIVRNEMLYRFSVDNFPHAYRVFWGMMQWYRNLQQNTDRILREEYHYTGKILAIDHHLAHAASTFFSSTFDDALILTMDGTGEKYSLAMWNGRGNDIKFIKGNSYPYSLGVLYSIVTYYIGLGMFGEGKTMGLAPYGKDKYREFFDELIIEDDQEFFCFNKKYLNIPLGILYINRAFTEQAQAIIGPARKKDEPLQENHIDLAASMQFALERLILKIVEKQLQATGHKNICLAGGVALNSVLNGKILQETSCEKIFIQPAAGDAGTALGVALHIYNGLLKNPRKYVMDHAYLGPEYTDAEIKAALDKYQIQYELHEDAPARTAKLLAEGNIVGWFQGKMEIGPRALGNRSILADPRKAEMKDILNHRVKHRESFRPFAPACTVERYQEFFDAEVESPYMILVCNGKSDKQALMPAIIHVDGTARLQTVNRRHNPQYWEVIDEFGKITGVPVILNTSFNVKGEPIVCSPEDAVKCFLGTNLDYLVIGNYVCKKTEAQAANLLVASAQEQDGKPSGKEPGKLAKWWAMKKYYPWYLYAGLRKPFARKRVDYYKDGGYDGKL